MIKLFGLLGLMLGSLLLLIMRIWATRKARRQDLVGGCVVCGSSELSIAGSVATCQGCGYVGRSDRGGTLSKQEIGAMYQHEDDRHPW